MTAGIILLAIAIVIVAVVLVSRSGGNNRSSIASAEASQALRTPLPPDLRDRILELIRQDKKILAIKKLREATGYGLVPAKLLVDALADGGGPPSTTNADARESGSGAMPARDLAARARQLSAEGQEVQAIRLVCDETGMGIPEAQNFIRSLGP